MRCSIEGINHQGEGVARVGGKAVFVPQALPGEVVEIVITDNRARFARAQLVQLLEASPYRLTPLCPHYYECGGCAYQHAKYEEELVLKRQIVKDAIQRIAKIATVVEPVLSMPEPWHYRNKVTWHMAATGKQEPVLGFFREASRQLVPISQCRLISEKMNCLTARVKALLPLIQPAPGSEITLRESSLDHSTMLIWKGLQRWPAPEIWPELSAISDSVVVIEKNTCHYISGPQRLLDKLGQVKFALSPEAFFQVNHCQAEEMIRLILSLVDFSGKTVLDAFCGVGSIALNLARQAERVIGVESYEPAIHDARCNAIEAGIYNVEFIHGLCERAVARIDEPIDVIVLDPPRSGCKKELIQACSRISPREIVYVSCNPATLSRDLALFGQLGYHPLLIQPIDMFPRTYHVEVVVMMTHCVEKRK
ncbi:23S rRNA (uracil(1939)-C(5))-methyltransferase RlmD [Syntrophomonas wolfei]|uniref:23S rRNA (uracil(1939)-C(5))-methyltransferase RlmD n=1 Tax=Syntrophomonas wolfei TaxID=863 RepID=UPI0023F29CE2|nr:23S rRNA (uracil(1939)-C(5))-methyltransferase RlmD [Syntrophomonas wolfei]